MAPYKASLVAAVHFLLWTTAFARSSQVTRREDVQLCSDVVFDPNNKELQVAQCHRPATSAKAANADGSFAPMALVGPTCEDDAGADPPGDVDATTLCESLPMSFSQTPAPDSGACSQTTWSVGTARFAIINCNTCESLDMQGDTLRTFCTNLKDVCTSVDFSRGYYVDEQVPAWWVLWGIPGDGDVPLYTGCS